MTPKPTATTAVVLPADPNRVTTYPRMLELSDLRDGLIVVGHDEKSLIGQVLLDAGGLHICWADGWPNASIGSDSEVWSFRDGKWGTWRCGAEKWWPAEPTGLYCAILSDQDRLDGEPWPTASK